MNVVLQPASTGMAPKHYQKTIRGPASLAEIRPHVPAALTERLERRYPSGQVPVWGAVAGNWSRFDRMREGDLVLFYESGRLFSRATVTEKLEDGRRLAETLWSVGKSGPFEHVFFLEDVRPINVPWPLVREALGWEADRVQRLTILSETQKRRVLAAIGDRIGDVSGPAESHQEAVATLSGEVVDPSDTTTTLTMADIAEIGRVTTEGFEKGQGYARTSEVRRAVELYAMRRATLRYESHGFEVEDASGSNPFDLLCRKGQREVRVEVKGAQSPGHEVILTKNEVDLARDPELETELFIQSGIEVRTGDDGKMRASGGTNRVIAPWNPTDEQLTPLTYRCRVNYP